MRCWICQIEVTKENTSGSAKAKNMKSECRTCHKIYNYARWMLKSSLEEVAIKLKEKEEMAFMCKLTLKCPTENAGELSKRAIRRDYMYVNVYVPLIHNDENVTLVVTEVYYTPAIKRNDNREGLPPVVIPETGYAFVTESGDDLTNWRELAEKNSELVDKTILNYILNDGDRY